MEKNAYIGVDPGKAGFITIFKDGQFSFYPMPEHKVETGKFSKKGKPLMKTEFHEEGFRDLVFKIARELNGYQIFAAIEEVNGRQGWSAQNNFAFGHTAGLIKMTLIMLNAKVTMVRPQKWQTEMYRDFEKVMVPSSTGKTMVHDTKATSAIVAEAMGPGIDFRKTERSKTNDDNKTDSFLICLYLYRLLNKKGRAVA
jgi:hypothetical protein